MPPIKRTSASTDEDDKPDLSDLGRLLSDDDAAASGPKAKKPRGAPSNPDGKSGAKAKGRPSTSAEYVQLFQRVEGLGKKAAFEGFPGRTKNQAYQAWR